MLAFWRVLNASCLYLLLYFIINFPFSWWTYNSTVSLHIKGICDLNNQQFPTSKQTREPWLYVHALCVKASPAKTGVSDYSCYVQTSSFFRGGTSRMILFLYLISKNKSFPKDGIYQVKNRVCKSKIIGGAF